MDKKVQWALVAALWVLVVGALFIAWNHYKDPSPSVSRFTAENGESLPATALCPVTGVELIVTDQTPSVRYEGKLYFFDNTNDGDGKSPKFQFLMNPSRWVTNGANDSQETE